MQRSRGSGHGVVVSKICYNTLIVLLDVLWDCCKPVNSCRDWDFSNSELEVGLPAFQLRMSQNVTHCRKEICSTCMFKASIPTIPSGNSKHPEAWASWELRTFRHLCIRSWLHHAHPFVAAVEKNLSYAQKWLCPRFGLQDIDCALSCAIWLVQTSEQLSRLRF